MIRVSERIICMKHSPKTFAFIVSMVASLFLSACERHSYNISGELNEHFISKLEKIPEGTYVSISSPGGLAKYGRMASEIIIQKGLKVEIKNRCMSACAEYILLSTDSLTFTDLPIVGFHGNPLMHEYILSETAKKHPHPCYNSEAPKLRELYKTRGADEKFWEQQQTRLIIKSLEMKSNGCPDFRYKFEHKFWMPTSEQLRTHMGIEFEGNVCSDVQECIASRIHKRWVKGTSYVVENTIYISNGKK